MRRLQEYFGYINMISCDLHLQYFGYFNMTHMRELLSGFFLLRGNGYPPFPLRAFGQDDFPLRGEGGYPPIPLRKIPLKSRYFRFGPLYGLFLPIFHLI